MNSRWGRLADEWAIRDTLSRYWRGVDRRDEALVASTYHPHAYDDHGYFKGPVEGFIETLAPSVWAYFSKTQHFSGHIAIDFDEADPEIAYVESYAEAHHLRREDDGLAQAGGEEGADGVSGRSYESPGGVRLDSPFATPTTPRAGIKGDLTILA